MTPFDKTNPLAENTGVIMWGASKIRHTSASIHCPEVKSFFQALRQPDHGKRRQSVLQKSHNIKILCLPKQAAENPQKKEYSGSR